VGEGEGVGGVRFASDKMLESVAQSLKPYSAPIFPISFGPRVSLLGQSLYANNLSRMIDGDIDHPIGIDFVIHCMPLPITGD
jgi:hypothetical protein